MSLNSTFHGLDVTYSGDLSEVEQPQKRFKAVRRRSAKFHRPSRPKPLPHRKSSDALVSSLTFGQVS
ncbi:hypothetical protein ACOMHN_023043 [Nucella lapillus]